MDFLEKNDEWTTSRLYAKVREARRSRKAFLFPSEFLIMNPSHRKLMEDPLADLEEEMMDVNFLREKPIYGVQKNAAEVLVFDGGHRILLTLCLSMPWVCLKVIDIPFNVAVEKAAILTCAVSVTESSAEDLGVLAQVRLFGFAREEFMKRELQRPDVLSNQHQPRAWHTSRAFQEMMDGAPVIRGVKHFVECKNATYHRGAEILLEANVVETMCKWEDQGLLKWKFKDLIAVGKWRSEDVANTVREWERQGPENIRSFTGTFTVSIARKARITGSKVYSRVRARTKNRSDEGLEEEIANLLRAMTSTEPENEQLQARVIELECVKAIRRMENNLSVYQDYRVVVGLLKQAREELLCKQEERNRSTQDAS